MSNNSKLIRELLDKYTGKVATEEEIRQLFALIANGSDDDELKAALLAELEGTDLADNQDDRRWDVVLDRIKEENRMCERKDDSKRFGSAKWLAVAASIVVVFAVGGYFVLRKSADNQQVAVNKVQHDVLPGGNKAYLTLGNGQRISLTDAKNGTIANEAGKTIQKTGDGMLVYDDSHSNHRAAEIIYNTIETPRGGQYQVVLPDGSKVWLNAASSLKYPATFNGPSREVTLIGEAYFEVAKDKAHPFRVKGVKQTVEVLGTHFNINSYDDEPAVKTTLLEGSVKVDANDIERVIKPGEQAILSASKIKVEQADLDEAVAWKNGMTLFSDQPLESIMRTISRWYDVDVRYDGVNKQQLYGGGVSRYDNVSKVLKVLEMTGGAHFRIEGKTIYVSK